MGYVIYQNYNDKSSVLKSFAKFVGIALLVPIYLAALVAVFFTLYVVFSTLYVAGFVVANSSLPVLVAALEHGEGMVFFDEFLSAVVFGAIAGMIIGIIRRWYKVRNKVTESFISSIVTRKLFNIDHMFMPSVMISTFVGLFVGLVTGIRGDIAVHQLVIEGYHNIFAFISLVGTSGSGVPIPVGISYWLILLVLLIILIQAVIASVLLGAGCYVGTGMVIGAAKGSAKGLFRTSVEIQDSLDQEDSMKQILAKNSFRGAFEGGIAGVIVGIIQGAIAIYKIDSEKADNIATFLFIFIFVIVPLSIKAIEWFSSVIAGIKLNSSTNHYDDCGTSVSENKHVVEVECPFCKGSLQIAEDNIKNKYLKCHHCDRVVLGGSHPESGSTISS